MNRTAFLIDGFNLYHSLVAASRDLGGVSTKWLDIHSLCSSYLHIIGGGASIESIYYFSALATHMDPNKVARHKTFIKALESTGIKVQLGRFKNKEITCPFCKKRIIRHEEKETDVAISVKLIELALNDEWDTIVVVTGDTDIAPAIRTSLRLYPQKKIYIAFPYKRKNQELAKLTGLYFQIYKEQIARHQFANPLVLTTGQVLNKPMIW